MCKMYIKKTIKLGRRVKRRRHDQIKRNTMFLGRTAHVVKMSCFPKIIYKFSTASVKILVGFCGT